MIESIVLLGALLVMGLCFHHGMSISGLMNDKSMYSKTIVSKMYSNVLPPLKNGHMCPRTKKQCHYNDHLGCKHFQTLDTKKNKIVCNFTHGGVKKGSDQEKALEFSKVDYATHDRKKLVTDIDRLANVLEKHKRVVFDMKLADHLGVPSKQLSTHINCLEKYKFIRTYIDPVDGMTIVWEDKTDLIKNGYSQEFIKQELQNRKKVNLY
ncbi:MAG: hypothetical protein V1744_05735 [Candidatus Altiarchaeota archaeon]